MKLDKKKIANILIVVSIVRIALEIATFFQAEWQLNSPLIPKSTIITIIRPYLLSALISTILLIPALIFYFFNKYVITYIFCGFILMFTYFFFFFIFNLLPQMVYSRLSRESRG